MVSFDTKSLICLVRLAGIEPTTPWFVAKYSIQLSYSREALNSSTTFWWVVLGLNLQQRFCGAWPIGAVTRGHATRLSGLLSASSKVRSSTSAV